MVPQRITIPGIHSWCHSLIVGVVSTICITY